EASASRRPHHAEDEYRRPQKAARLPRQHPAHSLGRKDRAPLAGQGKSAARHDQARIRTGISGQVRESDFETLWHGAGHGATGSGKTNTLYSSIARLNTPDTNIMTAEDPVEFQLQGVNQVQMKEQIGLNFAAALRAFLRQDPNIILVGEIRDFET